MSITWNDNAPIYRQLRDRVVAMILDGVLKQGDALPSVRQVAADFQFNPITVSKAYQELVDEQFVEKRRGIGMYVSDGARDALMRSERDRFLTEEWPLLYARLKRMNLDLQDALATGRKSRRPLMSGAIVTARGLTKRFGNTVALDNVNSDHRTRPHRRSDRPERRRKNDGAEGNSRPHRVRRRVECARSRSAQTSRPS